ncbi:MAG: hypothetical protein KatS3mg110_0074 [Pirellulaceae bacterium]|nr:MAG: hypothetical protein KatS3mg110_0074 [Pirellulaceae bacterium]
MRFRATSSEVGKSVQADTTVEQRMGAATGGAAGSPIGSAARPGSSAAPLQERLEECRRVAKILYDQSPHWLVFFREILGVDGVVARLFPSGQERQAFEQSEHAAEIRAMLHQLRSAADDETHPSEPLRMITVRLPASVHEFVRAQARAHGMSMNQYCISRLLQWGQVGEKPRGSERDTSEPARKKPRPK